MACPVHDFGQHPADSECNCNVGPYHSEPDYPAPVTMADYTDQSTSGSGEGFNERFEHGGSWSNAENSSEIDEPKTDEPTRKWWRRLLRI